jgi:penicillin-binding protein 1C
MKGSAGSGIIDIIYPQGGMTVASPVALDSRSRGVVFSSAHADPDATLYWHLDDSYLGSTSHGQHKMKAVPSPGSHLLVITDANGNTASVRFEAR